MRLDDSQQTTLVLAEHVETFISGWEKGGAAPQLAEFLPEKPPELRRMALIELIKVDLEYRWQPPNQGKRVEEYRDQFPELQDELGIPCDLIYEEYHVRRQAGDKVDTTEYFHRFPEQAHELKKLLSVASLHQESTVLFSANHYARVQAGDRLDDFELLVHLGKGAFASVFLARQVSMQRLVALKVSDDKGTEPQTLAQLDHPHIVRVYDQRLMPERRLRMLYMQYVSGGTLQDVIKGIRDLPRAERTGRQLLRCLDESLEQRGELIPVDSPVRDRLADANWPSVVCQIGSQLAQALDYAQLRGVLHRDVKPANVLVAADGTPKLADFNISFSSHVDGSVPAAYFGGSLAYMSPEQLEACDPIHPRQPDELDDRSDMYSLGVVLWELLYGERPFRDERVEGGWSATVKEMVERRRNGVEAVSMEAPGDPFWELENVLVKCLQPDRDERWAGSGELTRRLQLCLQPHAQSILNVPTRSWRDRVSHWPILVLLLSVLPAHALFAWFNLTYNLEQLIPPTYWNTFDQIQMTINGIAFPVGIAVFIYLAWPVAKRTRRRHRMLSEDGQSLAQCRRRALQMGEFGALIGLALWITAGIAYPICVRIFAGPLPTSDYPHLLLSLTLCGLIAATFSFFMITVISLRALYPALLPDGLPTSEDRVALDRLARICGNYLLVAGSAPMLAILLLVLTESAHRFAFLVLSVVGMLGFAITYWIYHCLQRDIGALVTAATTQRARYDS